MRKRFLGLVFIGTFLLSFGSPDAFYNVYICKGPQSKKYHLASDCRGLNRCSTRIYKVSLEEARQLGRTLCGFED